MHLEQDLAQHVHGWRHQEQSHDRGDRTDAFDDEDDQQHQRLACDQEAERLDQQDADPVTRAYVAGPALVEVGRLAVVGSLNVREQARLAMEELNTELGETVHLGVLEGNQVRYVDAVESERALRVVARTGTLVPAHCTSLGKAQLSQMTDQQVAELYPTSAEPFPTRTDRSISTQDGLMKELAKARNRGYAVNSGETEDDVGSVAVAFRDFGGRLAAVAVAAPSSRLNPQRISRIGELMIDTLAKAPESPRR